MWFFHRSVHLIDLLDGIVDIHNHILPALDDGAEDLESSENMIQGMRDCNISHAIATPHIMEDFYNLDEQKIREKYRSTIKELGPDDRYFLSNCAAEYMIDHTFIEKSCHRNLLLIYDKYVLTEFSYFQQPNFVNEVAFNLRTIDVVPILAHPERYRYLNNSKQYNELKNAGFHFQLNLLSLAGNYGRTAQERGFKLLETNQFDFVGTDAHNESHLESIQKYTIPKKYKSAFIQVVNKHKELINVN